MVDENAQAVQGDMTQAEKRDNVIRLAFADDPRRFDAFCERMGLMPESERMPLSRLLRPCARNSTL